MADVLSWLQATRVAQTVAESKMLTAALSATHLVGLTLIVGSAFVSALALTGIAFPLRSPSEATASMRRAVWLGLTISLVTGFLLFSGRAEAASENSFFQVKMLLLVAAASCQLAMHRIAQRGSTSRALQTTGVLGAALWVGVALAGCAFILLE